MNDDGIERTKKRILEIKKIIFKNKDLEHKKILKLVVDRFKVANGTATNYLNLAYLKILNNK